MANEGDIQRYFIQLLKLNQVVYWRQNLGAILHRINGKLVFRKNPMKGFPDVAGLCPSGRLWTCEIKSPGGKLSDEQQEWLAKLGAGNALVKVIYSVDEGRSFITEILAS